MKKRVPDAGDFLESYFLGLSCLVCSEQFYILISQTKASASFQWYLLLFTAFATLTSVLILYEKTHDEFITLLHYYYSCLLAFLVGFVWIKITSVLVSTCTTIVIGFLTTSLIIEACAHYSSNAKLLLSFIAGLLSARILPSFCWILTSKEDYESQSMSISLILSIARFSSCLLSICMKFIKAELSFAKVKSIKFESDQFSFKFCPEAFSKLYEFYCQRITTDLKEEKEIYLTIYSYIKYFFPIFCFFCSVVFFLPLSPVMDAHLNRRSKFMYAPHVIRSLSIFETASHLLGFSIGILFPASISCDLSFCFINMLNISIRLFVQERFSFFLKFFSNIGIYLMVIVYSTLNGYVCSYDLFVIRNTFHNCKKEDSEHACCGDKFLTQCYCRYPAIIGERNKCIYSRTNLCNSKSYVASLKNCNSMHLILNFSSLTHCYPFNRFSCSKSFCEYKSLDYCSSGENAILLVQKGEKTDIKEIFNKLSCNGVCCKQPCEEKCGCLRLCGMYEIETVTTSTCDDCQLTVRIEGTKCDICSKCSEAGSSGTCSCNGKGSNSCCVCVKCCDKNCCTKSCTDEKCCIKLCCCKNCKNSVKSNGTRVFLFYENNDVCCIREIKPDTTPKFDGNAKAQCTFYISSIFISDCCHSDIQVDLHCKMSNNFFRVTDIKYPKKTIAPTSVQLCQNNKQCCEKKEEKQCRCASALKKVIVEYPSEDPKSEDEKCNCPASCTKCSCCQPGNCSCTPKSNESNCCKCSEDGCPCSKGDSSCNNGCCKDGKCCCCFCAKFTISPDNSFDKRMKPVKIKLISIFWILFFLILILTYLIMSSIKVKELDYYDFKPVTSYEIITKKTKKNTLNSPDDVKRRIDGFLMNSGLESKEYDSELEHMLKLFECTLDPNNFTFLKHHLDEVSLKLLNNPVFILRTKIEMVTWSCCLGFMYTYIIEMLIRIQNFFVNWEYVWEKEYKYYRMKMANRINQFTRGSKFGVAALSESDIGLKTYMLIGKSRKDTLEGLSERVENYLDLYDGEIEIKEKEFPESLDERLEYFISIWESRIDHLEDWITSRTNVFDWDIFMEQYPDIRTWVNMFGRYIQGALNEVEFDEKKFNKGTEVFLIDKIN
uniref:Uncharacterized protein n=1 Tax=Theileria annulata TaxID=5874 RepID=A0A3B0NAV6_THEAN